MTDDDLPPPLETIRLTIELTREADLPNQWTSNCIELDIISAGKTPERALEAVAEAVRMTVNWETKHSQCKPSEAIVNIAAAVKARRNAEPVSVDASASPRISPPDAT